MIRSDGKFYNDEFWRKKHIENLIGNYKIGGLITFSGSVHGTFNNIKSFQEKSEIPLLIAADYERGLGTFIEGTLFPSNMAISATNDTSLAYKQGKITAIEAKAIGVNMILAPVLDINNNSANPIINFRSYGDKPETVMKYSIPFIKGIQNQNGVPSIPWTVMEIFTLPMVWVPSIPCLISIEATVWCTSPPRLPKAGACTIISKSRVGQVILMPR